MKGHFKAGSSPMHLTGTQKADTPHHLASEPGQDSGDTMHLQPGHTMGGGGGGGAMPPMGGGAPAPGGPPPGGAPPMAGADKEPDASDPNEAAEGEMGGAPPMGGKKRPGY